MPAQGRRSVFALSPTAFPSHFLTIKLKKMKRIAWFSCILLSATSVHSQTQPVKDSFYALSPVEVRAIRAAETTPFSKTNLSKKDITPLNLGQDLPFILNQTPSVVANADAGNGIGYTGLRIRGTDATRINITLNGIPFNDAESQGSFFVNLPDFTSSVQSIQIQRGVGTSSNGTGAFGATVSLSTNEVLKQAYGEISNGFGFFNTWRHTVKAGTGLINERFTIDARLSRISSDGYVDRASSDLQSFYLSGAWLGDQQSLRLNIFSGKEKTYQAWNGLPASLLKTDRRYNSAGTDRPGEPYDNETDNYTQTHYQLFYDVNAGSNWHFNTALFLTRGKGYYENYRGGEAFEDYGLPPISLNGALLEETDLVRQKWLDNHFYGQIFSAQYQKERQQFTLGGGWSVYDGLHHGDIVWAQYGFPEGFRYYDNDALKSDINLYAKWQFPMGQRWNGFTDVQYRHVSHDMNGFSNNPELDIRRRFNFINPKAGISYQYREWQAYLSYALGNKEPNRDDFEAGLSNQPRHETLHDVEAGVNLSRARYSLGATIYLMYYRNQLVLTGQINDVGAYTRINVPESYRAGVELQGQYQFSNRLRATGNLSLSRNRIKSFTEYLDSYDGNFDWIGQEAVEHQNTPIGFSPSVITNLALHWQVRPSLNLSLMGKYVGSQYLDNTGSSARQLDDFYTQDLRIVYSLKKLLFREIDISFQLNNLFNRLYEPNGYTYGYLFDGNVVSDNYYYPMAGRNFMMQLTARF